MRTHTFMLSAIILIITCAISLHAMDEHDKKVAAAMQIQRTSPADPACRITAIDAAPSKVVIGDDGGGITVIHGSKTTKLQHSKAPSYDTLEPSGEPYSSLHTIRIIPDLPLCFVSASDDGVVKIYTQLHHGGWLINRLDNAQAPKSTKIALVPVTPLWDKVGLNARFHIATESHDGIALWDPVSGDRAPLLHGVHGNLVAIPTKTQLAVYRPDEGALDVYNLNETDVKKAHAARYVHCEPVSAGSSIDELRTLEYVTASPNGNYLASICSKNVAKLWNHETQAEKPIGEYHNTNSVAFCNDNETVVLAHDPTDAPMHLTEIVNFETGQRISRFNSGPLATMSFVGDRIFATTSWGKGLLFAHRGQQIEKRFENITAHVMRPDALIVATAPSQTVHTETYNNQRILIPGGLQPASLIAYGNEKALAKLGITHKTWGKYRNLHTFVEQHGGKMILGSVLLLGAFQALRLYSNAWL